METCPKKSHEYEEQQDDITGLSVQVCKKCGLPQQFAKIKRFRDVLVSEDVEPVLDEIVTSSFGHWC